MIFIGYDARQSVAFDVTCHSIRRRLTRPISVFGLYQHELRNRGLLRRPVKWRGPQMWDVISDAPMSTEFACSRFLVPFLTPDWALFADCDVLARVDLAELFALADPRYAVQCVKHDHHPAELAKMNGLQQTRYTRKNWSSVVLWNPSHPANRRLTLDMVNELPGRDLHRFCWLEDDEVGALPPAWNWLAGVSRPDIVPNIVHFTNGHPLLPGCEATPYAAAWLAELRDWNAHGRAQRAA